MRHILTRALFCAVVATAGCNGTGDTQPLAPRAARPAATGKADGLARPAPPPTEVRDTVRLMALGDVHGDLDAVRDVLLALGVTDEDDHWIAGDLVVVQVGDQLDRGDGERAILDLFERLADEAYAAGGAFYSLLGNHEAMNAELDFRYVTDGGWADFSDVAYDRADPLYADYPTRHRGRVAAFRPGGPYARILAEHNAIMVVGRTVFVHGGLLPRHVDRGLERINREIQSWLRGDRKTAPAVATEDDGPFWSRIYSDDEVPPDAAACAALADVLEALDADQMVVGHTVQLDGITSACDGLVWRIDTGLAAYYGGPATALEIDDDEIYLVDIQ